MIGDSRGYLYLPNVRPLVWGADKKGHQIFKKLMDIISADQQYAHIKVLSFIQLLIKPSNICLVPGNNFIQLSVHPSVITFTEKVLAKATFIIEQ